MTKEPRCEMTSTCEKPISHLDKKGFIYCEEHGRARKYTVPCRRLTSEEIKTIKSGKPIKNY